MESNDSFSINPATLEQFLRAQGWRQTHAVGRLHTWASPGGPDNQTLVAIPQRMDLHDYGSLVKSALRDIGAWTGATAVEITEDIIAASADTIRVRLTGGVFNQGRAPLSAIGDMMDGVRDLFYAGASSMVSPRRVHSGGTQNIRDYLQRLQVGTPERGSFIVRVLSPIDTTIGEFFGAAGEGLGPKDSFGRQAVESTIQSVEASISTARDVKKSSNYELFESRIEEGISANLCEALTNIVGETPNASLGVYASWSRRLPGRPNVPHTLCVDGDLIKILATAGPILRGRDPKSPITIEGRIHLLREESDSQLYEVGIHSDSTGGPRRIRVHLDKDQYARAITAHAGNFRVKVKGVIKYRGNYAHIYEPQGIDILDAPDDIDFPAARFTKGLEYFL